MSLVQTGRTFLRFHHSPSVFLFLTKSDRLSFFPYTRTGYIESLFKDKKLNWIRSYSSVSLSFVGTLYGISRYRLFESYSKYVYRQQPAFHLAILVCFLKWPTIVIYKLPGSLLFCYSTIPPIAQNLFRYSKVVIFVKYIWLFWIYNSIVYLNRQLHAVFFFGGETWEIKTTCKT